MLTIINFVDPLNERAAIPTNCKVCGYSYYPDIFSDCPKCDDPMRDCDICGAIYLKSEPDCPCCIFNGFVVPDRGPTLLPFPFTDLLNNEGYIAEAS